MSANYDIPAVERVRTALRLACDQSTQAEFAHRHNLSQGYVSAVLSGLRAPGDDICQAVGFERIVTIRYRRRKRNGSN